MRSRRLWGTWGSVAEIVPRPGLMLADSPIASRSAVANDKPTGRPSETLLYTGHHLRNMSTKVSVQSVQDAPFRSTCRLLAARQVDEIATPANKCSSTTVQSVFLCRWAEELQYHHPLTLLRCRSQKNKTCVIAKPSCSATTISVTDKQLSQATMKKHLEHDPIPTCSPPQFLLLTSQPHTSRLESQNGAPMHGQRLNISADVTQQHLTTEEPVPSRYTTSSPSIHWRPVHRKRRRRNSRSCDDKAARRDGFLDISLSVFVTMI